MSDPRLIHIGHDPDGWGGRDGYLRRFLARRAHALFHCRRCGRYVRPADLDGPCRQVPAGWKLDVIPTGGGPPAASR